VLEKPAPIPPPPPVVAPEKPEPVVDKRPEPVAPTEKAVESKPKSLPDRKTSAREKAGRAGLLPFADQLAELRDNEALNSITSGGTSYTGAVGNAPRVERSLITSKVGVGSGGINTAGYSRNTGGSGLGGRATTQVASGVAALGGGGAGASGDDGSGDGQRASRSREEIEMVFDQNKGAIYALYNRALRSNPALQGKLVLKLTIEPSGKVSDVKVVSSELGDEELERKLVQRIRMFSFLSKDVPPVTTTKPIDFFPA
jgi:TonB family protein